MAMAISAAATKTKGPLLDQAQCRCCRAMKKCRLLTSEYQWTDQKEVYSEMLMDCFGLLLTHLDGENVECGICATCVLRLRDASAFRRQVLQCEQQFLQHLLETKDDPNRKLEVIVKTEPLCEETGDILDGHNSSADDDIPLAHEPEVKLKINSAPERRESKPRKAKRKRLGVKKELLKEMKKLRIKLGTVLDETAPQKKEKRSPKQKRDAKEDHDSMVFSNAITIIHNSYVCPFTNRTSIYYCYYCKDQFTNPLELREHTMTHNPKEFENLIEYNKLPKFDITRIDCRLCEDKIDTIDNFKTHISTVHGKTIHPVSNEFLKFKLTMENLKCVECGAVFPFFDLLVKHMTDHFGTHVCDICGACFLELTSLRSHIKSHNRIETNFPCEICGKNLKSKYSRYLHVATVHEKKPTVNCYKCEESFLSYALRNKHLIEVHGDKRTFPCKLCDKVYNRRKTLVEHNRRNHLKVYRHQCDLCDQRFYLPSRLKEHMATHTGERNFRCEFCDKSYPRLQSLQEHQRSHCSNEKRFKCDVCGSTFSQSGVLKTHMKSLHHFDESF